MATGLADELRYHGIRTDTIDLWSADGRWSDQLEDSTSVVLHSVRNALIDPRLGRIGRYEAMYVMGADCIDGRYDPHKIATIAELTTAAYKMGVAVTVLGSSFSEEPNPVAVAALRALPESIRVNARDPLSRKRMQRALGRQIGLVADIAFLMSQSTDMHGHDRRMIANLRRTHARLIAVNISPHCLERVNSKHTAIKYIAKWLNRLAEVHNAAYVLVPHDFRDHNHTSADTTLLQVLRQHLSKSVAFHQLVSMRPRDVKAVLARCDLTLTGRMHVAIASLGTMTPAIAMTYADKFEGLFTHFGINPEDVATRIEGTGDIDHVFAMANSALSSHDHGRDALADVLPRVESMARRNIDWDAHHLSTMQHRTVVPGD